jgi:hypothetical protein
VLEGVGREALWMPSYRSYRYLHLLIAAAAVGGLWCAMQATQQLGGRQVVNAHPTILHKEDNAADSNISER